MNTLIPRFIDVLVPWAMRHRWVAGQRYQSGAVEVHSLWLILEGRVQVKMGGREWEIGPGHAFLWPPHERREIFTPEETHWLSVSLRAMLFGQINLLELLWPPVMWQPADEEYSALCHAMEGLVNEWADVEVFPCVTPATVDSYVTEHFRQWPTRDTVSAVLSDAYAKTIIGLCWRMLSQVDLEQASNQNFPPWLSVALQRLRAEPDISIEKLAHEAGISPTQFRRQFQKWFGTSPREYINRLRLEQARQMLLTSSLSVQDIAEHVGFLSSPHFNHLFKQMFGLPPAQYRRLSSLHEAPDSH